MKPDYCKDCQSWKRCTSLPRSINCEMLRKTEAESVIVTRADFDKVRDEIGLPKAYYSL